MKPSKETVTTLSNASIERFLVSLSENGMSDNTMKAYGSDLRGLLWWTGQQTKKSSLPVEQFETTAAQWLNATRKEAAPKTTARRLTSLRSWATWAGMPDALQDYSAPTPARAIPHPVPEGIEGVLAMIAAARNKREAALAAMCGLVGLRVGSARTVRPTQFDTSSPDGVLLRLRVKGDREHIVPISATAWAHIAPAVAECVVAGRTEVVGYSDRHARALLTQMARRARLRRPVASHDLRAAFGTAAYERSGDLRAVQELLGHASSHTTEVYTAVPLAKMRKAGEVA